MAAGLGLEAFSCSKPAASPGWLLDFVSRPSGGEYRRAETQNNTHLWWEKGTMNKIKWRLSGAFVAIAFLALAFGLESPALADPGGGQTTLTENSLLIPAPPPLAKIVPATAFNIVSPPTALVADNSNANINSNVSPSFASVNSKDAENIKATSSPAAILENANTASRNGPTLNSVGINSLATVNTLLPAPTKGVCSGTELATASNLGANKSV